MVDVKELQILNTTKCTCGHQFTLKDFIKLEKLQDTHGFYANLVKHYSKSKCPNCKKEVILLLKQVGQTWEIMNTAITKNMNITENNKSTGETNSNLSKEKTTNQEFICPVCKKVCKSQIGLNSHIKTHQN